MTTKNWTMQMQADRPEEKVAILGPALYHNNNPLRITGTFVAEAGSLDEERPPDAKADD